MKFKLLYALSILGGSVGFVVFQVGFAGDKHVTVVKENIALFNENSSLKQENADLKQENALLDSLSGGSVDSLTQAFKFAVKDAVDSTKTSLTRKYENQINSLKDELQQAKDDLHDLDGVGRRIPLGPVK